MFLLPQRVSRKGHGIEEKDISTSLRSGLEWDTIHFSVAYIQARQPLDSCCRFVSMPKEHLFEFEITIQTQVLIPIKIVAQAVSQKCIANGGPSL